MAVGSPNSCTLAIQSPTRSWAFYAEMVLDNAMQNRNEKMLDFMM